MPHQRLPDPATQWSVSQKMNTNQMSAMHQYAVTTHHPQQDADASPWSLPEHQESCCTFLPNGTSRATLWSPVFLQIHWCSCDEPRNEKSSQSAKIKRKEKKGAKDIKGIAEIQCSLLREQKTSWEDTRTSNQCHKRHKYHHLMKTLHLTLKMTTAQVVETSVTNNSLSGDYSHLDDHTRQITNYLC